MAFDPDLDDCVSVAVRQMLDIVCERVGLDRYRAYTLLGRRPAYHAGAEPQQGRPPHAR
jgi:hypothetical protein